MEEVLRGVCLCHLNPVNESEGRVTREYDSLTTDTTFYNGNSMINDPKGSTK